MNWGIEIQGYLNFTDRRINQFELGTAPASAGII